MGLSISVYLLARYRMFQITDDTVSVFSDLQSLTEDPEDETVPSDFTQK